MVRMAGETAPRETLALELRRGALALAALSRLKEEQYGYSLRKELSECGLEVDEGTLYPLLRRLESQGLLQSRWQLEEGRPRRYYRLSPQGEAVLEALSNDWRSLRDALERML
jgi:DNA-binding PadR family transcriptional regulator